MKWYNFKSEEDKLDFSKPIVAEGDQGKYLLLPQIEAGSYKVIGYNWFNIEKGKYNSCVFFRTAQKAVDSRSDYTVYNCDLVVSK